MLTAGNRVGVAVSGGADSVALLRLLHRLRDDLGITLAVVHFDHALRGAESETDAAFVAELARVLNLEFLAGREDVGAEAARQGWNLEDAGRRLALCIFRAGDRRGASNTHRSRAYGGRSSRNSSGPPDSWNWANGFGRNLSRCRRHCPPTAGHEAGNSARISARERQTWREDSTNRDLQRTRAQIREQLLPVLERDFSGAIVGALERAGASCAEEGNFWDALVEDRVRALAQERRRGYPHRGRSPAGAA